MKALVSIHDVMPETLDVVTEIIPRLPEPCLNNLVLLVVPGLDWNSDQIDQLRSWQRQGLILAGHGWKHEAETISSFYHRMHAAFISRRAAEHLALDTNAIVALLERNYRWFGEHRLDTPDFYVPPAWAMGKVSHAALAQSPYRYFETLAGIQDAQTAAFKRLPLAGFQADTVWRAFSLGFWNGVNRLCETANRPLRIAIHPQDFQLGLANKLTQYLNNVKQSAHYRDVFFRA